jgi:hypothetical protein
MIACAVSRSASNMPAGERLFSAARSKDVREPHRGRRLESASRARAAHIARIGLNTNDHQGTLPAPWWLLRPFIAKIASIIGCERGATSWRSCDPSRRRRATGAAPYRAALHAGHALGRVTVRW